MPVILLISLTRCSCQHKISWYFLSSPFFFLVFSRIGAVTRGLGIWQPAWFGPTCWAHVYSTEIIPCTCLEPSLISNWITELLLVLLQGETPCEIITVRARALTLRQNVLCTHGIIHTNMCIRCATSWSSMNQHEERKNVEIRKLCRFLAEFLFWLMM